MHTKSVLAATAIAGMVAVSINTVSFASGGPSVLLGKSNHTKKTTTIVRDKPGAPLSLKSKPGSPSLKVSSGTVVPHLNADQVDGLDAKTLVGQTTTYSLANLSSTNGQLMVPLPSLPGTYLVSYQFGFDAGRGTSDAPVESQCYLLDDTGTIYQGYGLSTSTGYYPAPSATAVVSTPGKFTLTCDAENGADFTSYGDQSSYISFTKILKPVDGGKLTAVASSGSMKGAPRTLHHN